MSKGIKTRQAILDEGMKLWPDVSSREIGRRIGVTHAAVAYYFDNRSKLRDAIAQHAVKTGNVRVIAQLIAVKHPSVESLSAKYRSKILNALD